MRLSKSTTIQIAGTSKQQCLWLVGNPGAGKTFMGDYLATRGWHHIDGDQGNQSKDPKVQEVWGKLYNAMMACSKGQKAKDSDWQPYFEFLIEQYREALKSGKNVVLSFAIYNLFGDAEFIRKALPGIKFVVVTVSEDLLIERVLKRSKETLEKAGTTQEECWKQDYMAEYRERYGEEYTPERWKQMEIDGAKELQTVKLGAGDKGITTTISNDDWASNSAIKALNGLVGLDWEEVDSVKIAAVNMKRMESLNLDMPNGGTQDAGTGVAADLSVFVSMPVL